MNLPDTNRRFMKMSFCGPGEYTRSQIKLLHGRIDKALKELSGRQQGPHWREQPSQERLDLVSRSNQEAELVCQQVVRDVAMALTGKEIVFVGWHRRALGSPHGDRRGLGNHEKRKR